MNRFASTLYRNLSCAFAATLITVVLGLGFVESTSAAPSAHAPAAEQSAQV